MAVIRVALDIPVYDLFDYLIADNEPISIGDRVIVPFGHRKLSGIVLEISTSSKITQERLKTIINIPKDMPPLMGDIINLAKFCSSYYHQPIGEVVHAALPTIMRKNQPYQSRISEEWLYADLKNELLPKLSRSPAKLKLYEALKKKPLNKIEIQNIGGGHAIKSLKIWEQQGYVTRRPIAPASAPTDVSTQFQPDVAPELNPEQKQAIDSISQEFNQFIVWLLQGITGSGKTEIYLRLIEKAIQAEKQVLMMVPEINLTPQLSQRIQARFSSAHMVNLHSGLTAQDRFQNWMQAQSGFASIILTTRLGVFTPLPRLGLIIIDEEHDPSYKQQEGIRYHARDVAIMRGKSAKIPVLLGSATPSLESLANVGQARYRHLLVSTRANPESRLPRVSLVDLRSIQLNDGLSDQVIRAIQLRIERGEQSMLFLNRRGFAPVLYCPGCGWISPCKRCSSNMVVHLYQKTLHCHHCGTVEPIPSSCPECGELDLRPIGMGTQRLETNLSKLFPQARILRIDRDNTQGKNIFNQIFSRIAMGDVDIILGTQMLTKGHDFPKLTLVIILNADSMLFSSDFRAQERLFTQLMQVSGRSGRAHLAGEVLIQTSFPAHPIFRAVQSQDFSTFAHTLLSERKNLGFPPYTFLAVLKAEASELAIALRFLKEVQDMAKSSHSKVTIFDPVPTFMYRRKNREYAQLLMQANQRTDLHQLLSRLLRQLPRHKEVKWHIDIDPVEV